MTTQDTPRRATFDDLRVGQTISVVGIEERQIGTVEDTSADSSNVPFIVRDWTGVVVWALRPDDDTEITILRDAPAPPVAVRREDYDALVASVEHLASISSPQVRAGRDILAAARALIDNAEAAS